MCRSRFETKRPPPISKCNAGAAVIHDDRDRDANDDGPSSHESRRSPRARDGLILEVLDANPGCRGWGGTFTSTPDRAVEPPAWARSWNNTPRECASPTVAAAGGSLAAFAPTPLSCAETARALVASMALSWPEVATPSHTLKSQHASNGDDHMHAAVPVQGDGVDHPIRPKFRSSSWRPITWPPSESPTAVKDAPAGHVWVGARVSRALFSEPRHARRSGVTFATDRPRFASTPLHCSWQYHKCGLSGRPPKPEPVVVQVGCGRSRAASDVGIDGADRADGDIHDAFYSVVCHHPVAAL